MKRIYQESPTGNFIGISNEIAQSRSISLSAKGMLLYLWSQPQGRKINVNEVERACGIGRDARRAIFKELEAVDYIVLRAPSEGNGELDGRVWRLNGGKI